MAQNPAFKISDFDRYFSRGTDKVCYISEKFPGKLLKISPLAKANQMIREIQYFEYLTTKGISPSFMPKFFGRCSDKENIGFVQELLVGNNIKSLIDIVRRYYLTDLAKVEDALMAVKNEMLEKNIIVLDLHGANIIGDIETLKLWIIDGYGTPEFIPLPKYFRFFGRMKIERQWKKFVYRYSLLVTGLSREHGVWMPSKIASGPIEPKERHRPR